MIIFIYNLVVIIFSLVLITSGNITSAYTLYIICALGAIILTSLLRLAVLEYPTTSKQVKDSTELIFYTDYQNRLSNYIGSSAIHIGITLFLLHSLPLALIVLGVAIIRISFANSVNKRIKEYKLTKEQK